jgi:hypothetical protein
LGELSELRRRGQAPGSRDRVTSVIPKSVTAEELDRHSVVRMQVIFTRHEAKGRRACSWYATRAKRIRVPGAHMAVGNGLPHDLAQYVVEAAVGYDNGFWGLVSRGATFRSTDRKRTKPGRALIAANRGALDASEQLASVHLASWRSGEGTAVTAMLERAFRQWSSMGDGDTLIFEWPTPSGMLGARSAVG